MEEKRLKIAVLDRDTLGTDLPLDALSAAGELRVWGMTPPELAAGRLAGADAAVINKVRMDRAVLDASPSLKLICLAATGYDNVDIARCRELGIAVCNVAGYSTESVAQITAAMALSLYSRLPAYTRFTDSGEYSRGGLPNRVEPVFHEMAGKTWGIVGFGAIGRRVAKIAEALGCRVLVCRRTASEDCADIDTLCREADILSIHVPLTEETRGMINAERIARMKRGAVVINAARGAVADEAALADAVLEGRLGGLGADVYSREPFPEDHPFARLRGLDNVCLTPHMAWGAYEARLRCLEEIAENIRSYRDGGRRNRIV